MVELSLGEALEGFRAPCRDPSGLAHVGSARRRWLHAAWRTCGRHPPRVAVVEPFQAPLAARSLAPGMRSRALCLRPQSPPKRQAREVHGRASPRSPAVLGPPPGAATWRARRSAKSCATTSKRSTPLSRKASLRRVCQRSSEASSTTISTVAAAVQRGWSARSAPRRGLSRGPAKGEASPRRALAGVWSRLRPTSSTTCCLGMCRCVSGC